MEAPNITRLTADLRSTDSRIFRVLLQHPEGMRPADLKKDSSLKGIHDMTLHRGLKRLMGDGLVVRRVREVKGKPATLYAVAEKLKPSVVGDMERKLYKMAKEALKEMLAEGLTEAEKAARLREALELLLDFQRALSLMAIEVSLPAPDVRTAVRRLLWLTDSFTIGTVGNALGLCWLNKDVAAKVLEAMLPKGEG